MQFSYNAVDKNNQPISGVLEAVSKDALVANLNQQGLHPLSIKIYQPSTGLLSRLKSSKKVKTKDLVIFTRQLSTMISAGVPIARSLATLQEQSNSKYFRQIVNSLSKDIEGGMPLGDAFAKYPQVFSEVYINMIRAGEAGGILDDILKRLASQVEQDASIRKKIKGAMTYPLVILTITIIAFFGIMIFIIPKISKILKDLGGPHAQLPVYTRALLSASDFARHYGPIIAVVLVLVIILIRRYINTAPGKYQFHQLLLRIPIVNTVITKVAVARFARTFASLSAAGVGVLEALEVTGKAMGNKVIEADLERAAKAVKNGKQLSEPLSKSKYFPPIVSQMLAVGEETGQVDKTLVKVADFYEEEVDTIINSLSSIIEPVMIIILGSFVGLIAASVMGPIASLSRNIGNN